MAISDSTSPNQQQIKSFLRQKSHEIQALQEEANRLILPDDIPLLISTWHTLADNLPDELEQKQLIKKELDVALRAYNEGNEALMRLFLLRAQKNSENAKHDKWALGIEEREVKELAGSKKGGSANKKRTWAVELAAWLKKEYSNCTKEQVWNKLPESHDPPLTVETDDSEYTIYQDGNKLVARNTETEKESPITKSTFFKNYFHAKGK